LYDEAFRAFDISNGSLLIVNIKNLFNDWTKQNKESQGRAKLLASDFERGMLP